MRTFLYIVLSCLFGLISQNTANAQTDSIRLAIEQCEAKAKMFSGMFLYKEALEEIQTALLLAEQYNLEDALLNSNITLAEFYRKTEDYTSGLELLYTLSNSASYPRLHVRKLGRIAALYNEIPNYHTINNIDSVIHYLNIAIDIAEQNNFLNEEADLKNELGYTYTGSISPIKGEKHLRRACELYKANGDTLSYISSSTNLTSCLYRQQKIAEAQTILSELLGLVASGRWLPAEHDVYEIAAQNEVLQKDSLAMYRWRIKAMKSNENRIRSTMERQISSLKIVHETSKYQKEAETNALLAQQKSRELNLQESRTQQLLWFASILIVLMGIVAYLFYREYKLKKESKSINEQLNLANEKYHMLLVESNHRIKNNLQMMISMLQYASKEMGNEHSKAFKWMSGKIQIISLLHKRLSLDIHNENVALDSYYDEIITLYKEISPTPLQMDVSVADVQLKSDRILYFGLILNEMISNTIEHNPSDQLSIQLSVVKNGTKLDFAYTDFANIETNNQGTGSKLIQQLIHRVGGDSLEFAPSQGLYKFSFHA